MARFDNKVVLVSGGARGQGAAEARLLVAQGTVLHGRRLLVAGGRVATHIGRSIPLPESTLPWPELTNWPPGTHETV
jgi:NAD(P)-dependent dehydrogenase (short-subunit alcohol dehydrogenase family)